MLGPLWAPGESVHAGWKNFQRGAAGQILDDSGGRSQTGEAQIRAEPKETSERSGRKDQTGKLLMCFFLQMWLDETNNRGGTNAGEI